MKALRHFAVLLGCTSLAFQAVAAPPPVGAAVDLHIDAVGIAAPDFAVATVTLTGTGASREAAQKSLADHRDTLMTALAGLGIAAAKVKLGDAEVSEQELTCFDGSMCTADNGVMVPMSEIPPEAFLPDGVAEGADPIAGASDREMPVRTVADSPGVVENLVLSAAADPYGMRRARLWVATSDGTVQVDDLAKLADVGTAIEASGKWSASATRYAFIDRPKSHKAALADGLARARAEADAYAASIGYRVVRIKGMSNTAAPFAVTDIFTMMTRTEGPGKDNKFVQSDFAPVGVDFLLAPK